MPSTGHVVSMLMLTCLATVARGSLICDTCNCKADNVVDCTSLGLETHFNASEWNASQSDIGIKTVLLDHNELVHVTPFPPLPLVTLSLSHNRIAKIDDLCFRDLPNLTELDLSHNQLTSDVLTPNIFQGRYAADNYEPLRFLTVLRLGSNALHTLHPDLFEHLPNLETLTLDSNPFTVLDRVTIIAIVTPAYLKVLDLSYTGIKELPDHMLHTPRFLQELNLGGNRFTRVPRDLAEAIHLQRLTLDENPIPALTTYRAFPEMPELRSLRLSWMPNLTEIQAGALGSLPKLEELVVTHNPLLTVIHPSALSTVKEGEEGRTYAPVTRLLLNNNNLGYLGSELIGRWDKMEALDLQMNPWVCDCENQWLVSTLASVIEANHPENMKDFVCEEPSEMRGQTIAHLQSTGSHMRCLDLQGNHPEKDGHVLVGVLIGSLLAVPATLALLLLWRRYRHLVVGPRSPADYSRAFYTRAGHTEEF